MSWNDFESHSGTAMEMVKIGVGMATDPLGKYCWRTKDKRSRHTHYMPRKSTSYLKNPEDKDRIRFDIEGNEYELMYVSSFDI